jgi:TrmH family RNA methyltransferase
MTMKTTVIHTENAEFQIIESLKLNRVKRARAHEIFIEGIESIKQALRANLAVTRIIVMDSNTVSDWAKTVIGEHQEAAIIEMDKPLYAKLCDRSEPSEMLITAKVTPRTTADLRLPENPFIILFDRPSDAGNLGSIIRSANSFNVDAFLILGHGVDIYDPKVIRASLGSLFFTQITALQSLDELTGFIHREKERNGMIVLGTDSTGTVSLLTGRLQRPLMLIIGNEARGMSVALKGLCDSIISIPISGSVNSLNVASAAGILMWEVYKNTALDVKTIRQ